MACEKCGLELEIGMFPFCKGSQNDHIGGSYGVTADDIPGGIEIKHGICWPDGTPRKFYSKSEINKAAKAAGYRNHVEHVTDPKSGSDKNPYTTRWV